MAQPDVLGPPVGLLEAARRELEALEDKVTRRQLRLQDQSDQIVDVVLPSLEAKIMEQTNRMVDAVLPALEAKVHTLEQQMPMLDWRLSEFSASMKGLQGELEAQIQQSAITDARQQKWKKLFDEELRTRHAEHKRDIANLATMIRHEPGHPQLLGPGGTTRGGGGDGAELVTRVQLLDVTNLLRDELRKMVAQATGTRNGKESLRQEVHTAVDVVRATAQREVLELTERVAHSEQALGNLQREFERRPGVASEPVVGNAAAGREVEQLAAQTASMQHRLDVLVVAVENATGRLDAAEAREQRVATPTALEVCRNELGHETDAMWCALAEFANIVGVQGAHSIISAARGGNKGPGTIEGGQQPSAGKALEDNLDDFQQNLSKLNFRVDEHEQYLMDLLREVKGLGEILRQVAGVAKNGTCA